MLRRLKTLVFALLAAAAPAGELRVTLLQTADLHDHGKGAGHVASAPPDLGGYPRIAGYVAQVRACGHPVVLVDSGAWSMGTLYDLTLGRAPLALWFVDALRHDCITLGNHEFDHGPGGLGGVLKAAVQGFGFHTPIVASNLDPGGDPVLAPLMGSAILDSVQETLPTAGAVRRLDALLRGGPDHG
jgi:5'-nucleotidase